MKIKITVIYYLTLIRMATIKRTTEKFWKVYGGEKKKNTLFCTVGENET